MIVLESSLDRYENGLEKNRVVIQVDAAADVPTAQESWAPGSICIIAADHSYKRLNEQGEWV